MVKYTDFNDSFTLQNETISTTSKALILFILLSWCLQNMHHYQAQ